MMKSINNLKRKIISNINEWKNLPELPIKMIKGNRENGSIYKVIRVGFVMIEKAQGMVPYPTITIQESNGEILYRLPLELNGWVYDRVAFAHSGINYFPENVEFCNIQGKYTAI